MKVAIYGAGGVGGYFGGRLARAGVDVHLIARGDHLEALRRDGLKVRSVFGDFEARLPATDDPTTIDDCDYVLFCVKSNDTVAAAASLPPLIGADTAVISLQNGVDNEEILAGAIGARHVMGGVAYIFATIAGPGVIEHTGGPARIAFGELDGRRSARAEAFLEACQRAEIDAELSADIRQALWYKFSFICGLAGMTATTRLPIGELLNVAASRKMLGELFEEVRALAAAEGVELPTDLTDRHLRFADGLEPDSYSSLHYDLVHGKPMELEALHGSVVRRATARAVPVPMNRAIHGLLEPHARRNARAAGDG